MEDLGFVDMRDDEARECLFAEVQAIDPSVKIEKMMIWSSPRERLVYRNPELSELGIEMHCTFDRENWRGVKDTIKVGYADLFDFGIEIDHRKPLEELTSNVKSDPTNRYITAKRIVNSLRRNYKRLVVEQMGGEYARKRNALAMLRNQYALGIALQAIDIMETVTISTIYTTESYTKIDLAKYLGLAIRTDRNDVPTMELIISGPASPVDMVETIPYLQECGVQINDFKWAGETASVTMVMNLENGYDPAIFSIIQDCRMYQRQLANHLKEL